MRTGLQINKEQLQWPVHDGTLDHDGAHAIVAFQVRRYFSLL